MGFFELLDQACAVLAEAGYRDPWEWTPRQIIHRLEVHNRLSAQRSLLDLQVGVLAARGDQKHVDRFVQAQKRIAATDRASATDNAMERKGGRAASPSQTARVDKALEAAGWSR